MANDAYVPELNKILSLKKIVLISDDAGGLERVARMGSLGGLILANGPELLAGMPMSQLHFTKGNILGFYLQNIYAPDPAPMDPRRAAKLYELLKPFVEKRTEIS